MRRSKQGAAPSPAALQLGIEMTKRNHRNYTPADQPQLPSSAPPPDPPLSSPPPNANRSPFRLTAKFATYQPSGSNRSQSWCVCHHPIRDNHALRRRPATQPVVEHFRENTVQCQEFAEAQLRSVIGKGNSIDTLVKRHAGRLEPGGRGKGIPANFLRLRGKGFGRVPAPVQFDCLRNRARSRFSRLHNSDSVSPLWARSINRTRRSRRSCCTRVSPHTS